MKTQTILKLIFTLFILLTTATISDAVAIGHNDGEGEEIIIIQHPGDIGGGPRSQGQTLFYAELVYDMVSLDCNSPCGTVYIRLFSTNGDSHETIFDTSDRSTIIPTSGNSGYYYLMITLESGVIYYGEFQIQ